MNRQYEAIIFINPSVSQEEMNTIISKIKNILSDLKGNFIEEKQPEKVKLPYKMKKCKDGFYYYIKFEMSPDLVANFRDRIKLIEGIIRIMISLIVIKKVKIKDKKDKAVESINGDTKETEKSEQNNSEMTDFNEEAVK
ncbi:MAG: 30S ribosomal protein S6 [Candidatus Goldbacteria bacterium]|nr:30S ribosomal protein S6 [Candidatus Goldiibacteriota bacterium]